MKRFLIIAMLAAAAMLASVSCKENKTTVEPVKLEAPEYAALSAKYEFAQPVIINDEFVKSIEFTESGYAVIVKLVPVVKAEGGEYAEVVVVVKFSIAEDGSYEVENMGSVKVENETVTIAGETYTATVVDNAQISDEIENLCRTWKVASTDLYVKGTGEYGIGKIFDHGNIDKIVEWAIDKGVDVKQIEGYEIIDVSFTKTGAILVNFAGADPFYSYWDLSGEQFTYETPDFDGLLQNASAKGNIVREGSGYVLTAQGQADRKDRTYDITIELTLVPAETLKN